MSTFKSEQLARFAQSVNAGTGLMQSSFTHATDNAIATVAAAGYFNDARAKLVVGDLILVSAGIGATPITGIFRVATVPATADVTTTGGTITVS